MTLAEYYSIDEVLRLVPYPSRAAFRKAVRRGDFVTPYKIGRRWFFEKTLVHRHRDENTVAVTPEESNRTWHELEQEGRRRAERC